LHVTLNLLDAQLYAQTDHVAAPTERAVGTAVACVDGWTWVSYPDRGEAETTCTVDEVLAAARVAGLADVLPGPADRTIELAGENGYQTTMLRTADARL
jgi:hypothetical protein